jgi:hypothetical protein
VGYEISGSSLRSRRSRDTRPNTTAAMNIMAIVTGLDMEKLMIFTDTL